MKEAKLIYMPYLFIEEWMTYLPVTAHVTQLQERKKKRKKELITILKTFLRMEYYNKKIKIKKWNHLQIENVYGILAFHWVVRLVFFL